MGGILGNLEPFGSTNVQLPGSSTVYSRAIDMQGAEGVLFVIHGTSLFTVGSTGAFHRSIVQGSSSASGTFIALRSAGTTMASTAGVLVTSDIGVTGTYDYNAGLIDVYRPSKRYIKLRVDKSSDCGAITALKYNLRRRGSTEALDSSSVFGCTQLVDACTS